MPRSCVDQRLVGLVFHDTRIICCRHVSRFPDETSGFPASPASSLLCLWPREVPGPVGAPARETSAHVQSAHPIGC